MPDLDETHDPNRKSWVESGNDLECPFPIQNLPYGIFSTASGGPRAGVAIGDRILDLSVLEVAGLVAPTQAAKVFDKPELNDFMALGVDAWNATRAAIGRLLDARTPDLRDNADLRARALVSMAEARLHLPVFVRSYTDFYASREHATNVGTMFRDPDNALMPNWLHIPIGYNGRASSVVVSGTPVRHPLGQMMTPGADTPTFGACRKLDIELELGAIVGVGNALGEPVTVARAYEMIFGYVLLNDWSARDIQAWEYQPLGPFQGKAFGTTISPWIVTRAALEPFRTPTPKRVKPLLPYLQEQAPYNFDIDLEVILKPAASKVGTVICQTNYKGMYYSAAQQLAHHASGGCPMCSGDLLGSGTISGTEKDSLGSLLELTWNGRDPLDLGNGITRMFLEDGDSVTLRGWCVGDGYRIGFGDCEGTIAPSASEPNWAR
jgi:fumarylacetoacetase